MIMQRVLMLIRKHFPQTHILVRGDGHFSGPEMMQMIDAMPNTDFIFGLPGNVKLQALAEPTKQRACALWAEVQIQDVVPDAVRLYHEFTYAAGSWSKAWRVLLKAGVMALGENPRVVVTSLGGLDAGSLYEELYCAGRAENFIKHLKCDLASDRTSCMTFLTNCMLLPMYCTSNCALKVCCIRRYHKRNHQRSSPNYSRLRCRSGNAKIVSSCIFPAPVR